MIVYPVRAAGDGTERILDGNDKVLGTLQVVEGLNGLHNALWPVRAQIPNAHFHNENYNLVIELMPAQVEAIKRVVS